MIRYQLRSGRTILITMEQYLDMTDELHQKLEASGSGTYIEDPFLDFNNSSQNTDEIDIDLEQLPPDEIKKIEKEFTSEEDDEA